MRLVYPFTRKEDGSALIYILFLIAFAAIVGTVLLTTVTYGQKNVVNNQENLAHLYRVEGAFEIALVTLEEMTEEERYTYLESLIRDTAFEYDRYVIGDDQTPIHAYLTKSVLIEEPEAEQMEEQGEINRLEEEIPEQTRTELFTIKLFDPRNDYSREHIYREKTFAFDFEGDDGGQDPPTDCPYSQGCIDPGGDDEIIVPPPPSTAPDGTPYPDNIAYTYRDGEYKRIFHTGDPNLPPEDHILMNPEIDTSGILYLPKEMGNLSYGNEDIRFSADEGMFIGASVSNTSYRSIELTTDSGNLVLGEGVELEPTNQIRLRTGTGDILIDDTRLTSASNGDIQVHSGGTFSANHSILDSTNQIVIHSEGDFSAENSHMISESYGPIQLSSEGHIHLNGTSGHQTTIQSSGQILIEAGKAIYANHALLTSSGNQGTILEAGYEIELMHSQIPASGSLAITAGREIMADAAQMSSTGWTDIHLTAKEDISVQEAELQASRDLLFTSSDPSNTIYVQHATIRSRNNTAIARPVGIQITGRPSSGTIINE